MSNVAAFLLALAPAFAQDPRAIIQEVQKRQHSDSQRYEGTLEVMSQGNQLATPLVRDVIGLVMHRDAPIRPNQARERPMMRAPEPAIRLDGSR